MSTISLTNGIALPETFEGLRRIRTSIVDSDVIAALYQAVEEVGIKGRFCRFVPGSVNFVELPLLKTLMFSKRQAPPEQLPKGRKPTSTSC